MNKHTPKKKWGQNFLIDSNTINKIVSSIDFTENDRLLEIGPGKGAITMKLGENAKSLTAIEIDSKLSNILKKHLVFSFVHFFFAELAPPLRFLLFFFVCVKIL